MNHKERYHAMLEGKPVDRIPVTPIFMAWSAHHIGKTYRDYYLQSEVLVESQLAAARLLNLDQVSVISDPWCEASGYGMTFDFPEEGVGIPHDHLLHNHADVQKLKVLNVKECPRLQQRVDSVARLAKEVGEHTSVLGWVEGPISEYTDLRDMQPAMLDLVTEPQMYQDAMEPIIQTAITFALAQIQAGADTIGVGDAAASLIGPDLYVEHVLPWEKKLFDAIHEAGAKVKLHICGNTSTLMKHMAQSGADALDCDWMVDLKQARLDVGPDVTLCGHFDPTSILLQGTPQQVEQAARQDIADAGDRHVLQPGCEVPPRTSIANLKAFCPVEGSPITEALAR